MPPPAPEPTTIDVVTLRTGFDLRHWLPPRTNSPILQVRKRKRVEGLPVIIVGMEKFRGLVRTPWRAAAAVLPRSVAAHDDLPGSHTGHQLTMRRPDVRVVPIGSAGRNCSALSSATTIPLNGAVQPRDR